MTETSIHEACRRGDIDAVRALIAADPAAVDADDEHGWRPVFHAGLYRREQIVRLLIEAGADLAAHDGYAMHYAGEVPNNKAIVSLLVQYGALDAHVRPTDDLSRQFLAAVFLADTARTSSLLGRHPHLATAPDGRGDQPIHHAARNGDTEIVRLFIEHGADVNAKSTRGHTVLYCAGGHGHLDTLQLLLNQGTDCDARFTHDCKMLLEWLAQYPDDPRFTPITEALRQHMAGSQAQGRFLAEPAKAVEWFAARIPPASPPDPARVKALIADLDNDDFATREQATADLKEHWAVAAAALREVVAKSSSAEARRRAEGLLREMENGVIPPRELRALRAVEVLEWIATKEARARLLELTKGAPDVRLTREAAATCKRLEGRK